MSPSTFVAATTACAALARTVAGVGVKVAEPVVEVKPLIRYWTSWTGMVSAAVPIPVVKSVAEVVAVVIERFYQCSTLSLSQTV